VAEASDASGACPEAFEREMGCTAAELRGWLRGVAAGRSLQLSDHAATIALDGGGLGICWTNLPPRRIALLALPRLRVVFSFDGVDVQARAAFMQRFDLYTQRGGG